MSRPAPAPLQRVGPLAQLAAVLAEHGVALGDVLEGLPVTAAELEPDARLPITVISDILERAASRPGLAAIGLLLGRSQNHMALGPAGELMMSCDTLGSALSTFVAVQITNSTAGAAYLQPVGEDYALGFGIYAAGPPSSHIYDISAAIGLNLLRDLTGGAVAPLELLLSRPVPRDADAYRRHFRCPVRFNEGQTCFILPGRSLSYPLPTANARLREALLARLRQRMAELPQAVSARVRHVLRPLLLSGGASQRDVAARLNLHPRTMGRRLEQEQATFEQLKDEVRLAVSRELLARTDMAVADVASALGYATPSAFVRAFRRWTGASPSAWRRAARSGGS